MSSTEQVSLTTPQTPAASLRTIYQTPNYMAVIGALQLTPDWEGKVGYRIFNKRTGVCEQETNAESMAIFLCHRSEDTLKKVLDDPDGSKAAARLASGGYPTLGDDDDTGGMIPQ